MKVQIPVVPYRPYQLPLRRYIDEGGKRAVFVMHRRGGKDLTCFQIMIEQAAQHVGTYFYCLPEFAHARRVIWEGMTHEGKRFIDFCPKELVRNRNETEMKIELINGSIIRMVGADQYDRLVGTNPRGIVFSEFSLTNPMAWQLLRPILAANGGWAIFQGTPRGKNHLHDILKQAKEEAAWFHQVTPVTETLAISQEALDEEKRQMSPDLYAQEYLCSFDASAIGAYYAEEMRALREEKRLCKIPIERNLPVDTGWDLGINDTMVIILIQTVAQEIRQFKVIANNSKPLAYYAEELKSMGFKFGTHYLPHDAGSRQLSTGKSIEEQLKAILPGKFVVVPRQEVYAGIQKVRSLFPRFWIDDREETYVEALSQYCKEYDEEKKTFADRPLHDWKSHYADALRAYCMGANTSTQKPREIKPRNVPTFLKRAGVR